jgi:hypothetical protein
MTGFNFVGLPVQQLARRTSCHIRAVHLLISSRSSESRLDKILRMGRNLVTRVRVWVHH